MDRSPDPRTQINALYRSLLVRQANFDEFKQLLALYPGSASGAGQEESREGALVRARLNSRISDWLDDRFDGLSVRQLLQWRAIVVEEEFNVIFSPLEGMDGLVGGLGFAAGSPAD